MTGVPATAAPEPGHVRPAATPPDGGGARRATRSPLAAEALRRIGELYAVERMVSGRTKGHELERLPPWAWKADRHRATIDA